MSCKEATKAKYSHGFDWKVFIIFIITFFLKKKKILPSQFQLSLIIQRAMQLFACVYVLDIRWGFWSRTFYSFAFFMFLTEREEAAIEISEGNTTAGADVDKRVKRRLLMGKSAYPQ